MNLLAARLRRLLLTWSGTLTLLGARAQAAETPGDRDGATQSPETSGASVPAPAPGAKALTTPPSPQHVPVIYPSGARGNAVVYLEFTVTSEGRVRDVRRLAGRDPFGTAAELAAQQWLFIPAMRDGRPVAVRIRFRVDYEQTLPAQQAPRSQSLPRAPEPVGKARVTAGERLEVVVEAKLPPGAVSISRAEARELPGTFGDPTRALEVLPGVTPIVSALPLFFVRGAPPGNIGFFIDGIPVPLLYHAFLGVAVIHPAMTERVDFYRGPYPARYGRYAGSVAELVTTEAQGEPRGEASLRLSDAGAFVELPLFEGKGSALLAGRYSFTSLLVSQFVEGTLEYWDYQASAHYDIDSRHRVGLFLFGAFDFCKDLCSNEETGNRGLGTGESGVEFHRADVRYDHRYGRGQLRFAVTAGYDETQGGLGFNASSRLGQVRLEHQHRFSKHWQSSWGFDALRRRYSLDELPFTGNLDDVRELFFARSERLLGGHTQLDYSPTPRVTLTPGARADLYQSAGDTEVGIDPRLAARFRLTPRFETRVELGLSHQLPNYVPNVPGVQVAGIPNGLQKAVHSAVGFESRWPGEVTADFALFSNTFIDLTDPFGITQDFELDSRAARQPLTGTAQGLELLLRRRLNARVGAILSYTLSRTTRQRADLPNAETLAAYDRPHVLNAAVTYEPFDHWRFGLRSVLYSGIKGSRATVDGPIFDQSRGPPFFRLDWRAERNGRLGAWGSWALYAEVLNTTGSLEVIRRPCNMSGTRCSNTEVGPLLLPNLGFEIAY